MAVRPGKGDMIDLVNGLCLIQDKIQAERAFDFMKDPKLSNVEALKVPMFYVWSRLYGHTHTLSPRGTSAYWLARDTIRRYGAKKLINQLLLGSC